MTKQLSKLIEELSGALELFEPNCPGSFECEIYQVIDSEDTSGEEPVTNDLSILVKADQFQAYDPIGDKWKELPGDQLVFVLRHDESMLTRLKTKPDNSEFSEVPILRFDSLCEIPGHIAMHVAGAIQPNGESKSVDPIADILLPFPQYPDDVSESYDGYSYTSVSHLPKLIEEHCLSQSPWLLNMPTKVVEDYESSYRSTAWNPESNEEDRMEAEEELSRFQVLMGAQVEIHHISDEIVSKLADEDFERDMDPSQHFQIELPLYNWTGNEPAYNYPFLLRFSGPVFLPWCMKDITPKNTEYFVQRILLATQLPENLWPHEMDRAQMEIKTPNKILWPSFDDQVAETFYLRVNHLALEVRLNQIRRGIVAPELMAPQARIRAMQEQIKNLSKVTRKEQRNLGDLVT